MSEKIPHLGAVIVCAGSARRMGGIDKLLTPILGMPAAARSIAAFHRCDFVKEIVVVCREDQLEEYRALADTYGFGKVHSIVPGGETRQQSVFRGIGALSKNCEYAAIHDGARPMVTGEIISGVFRDAVKYGAATAAMPVKDTIKQADSEGFIASTPDRSTLYLTQTPQTFRLSLYREAMEQAIVGGKDYTDDCQLVEAIGAKVFLSPGSYRNLKLTTPEDIGTVQQMLEERESHPALRIGHGYDVHRLVEERKLILGGVEIPWKKGLLGHSDADVLLHAVSDALLGAAALGDIGQHFPDTDPRYKGADSLELLRQVGVLIRSKGFAVSNVDATVLAQAPKLKPHIPLMRQKIAGVLEIPEDLVSVKATTEEGLGFTGSGEGIAVHAVCLLKTL